MESKCKRFLSLLLVLVMVLGMFPMGHVHAAEAAELADPVSAIGSGKYIIQSVKESKYLTDTEAVSTGNSAGADGLALVNTADEAAIWTITLNEDGTYTISTEKGAVDVKENNHTVLTDGAKVQIVEGLDKYHADGMEIRKPGTNIGLNFFDSFSDATSTGCAASAWGSDDDIGNQWLLYKVPEVEVNLTAGESYEITGFATAPSLTDNEFVDVEANFVQNTVKDYQLAAETIDEGVYIIYNTRANKWMVNTKYDSANRLNYKSGAFDINDAESLWTVKKEGDKYTIQDSTGKYLSIPAQDQSELISNKYLMNITVSPNTVGAWGIANGDKTQYLNDNNQNSVGAYGPAGDGGSQWWFYKVADMPVYTYAGNEELPSDATITSGDKYILWNIRQGAGLLNQQNPDSDKSSSLYLNGGRNAAGKNGVWTITAVDSDGNYYVQDQNGKYLTFSGNGAGSVTVTPTAVRIAWASFGDNGDAWEIKYNNQWLSNYQGASARRAGGWHEANDSGSRWQIFKAAATPVGTYDVTVTAKTAGDAVIRFGTAIYTFHVSAGSENPEVCEHNWVDATCTTPKTCYLCNATEGGVDSDNHVNTETREAKAPTLTEAGYTGDTWCTDCNTKIGEGTAIAQLLAAAQLNNGKFAALEDNEYTLVVDTNGNRSLVHGGTYYVMPKGDRSRAKVPQGINRYTLTIAAYNADDNYVTIYGHNGNDDGYLYFHSGANEAPEWNRNSVIVEKCAISLFRADANSTNTEIYGYTRVKASELEADGRYLIAAKHANGSWYVMAPSTSTNNKDHIAQVVATDKEIHDHTFGEWTVATDPTCTTTGTKTQSCDCGHVHTEVIAIAAHTAGDPVVENESDASYDQVVYCTECNTELSRETISLLTDKVVVSTIDVSLDAEIMLKYGVIIPEELIEGGAYIVLTKDGGYGTVTKEFKGEELAACKSDDKYVVAIGVASGEMNSPVKIEVFDGRGNALDLFKKDGTELGAATSSTVVDFAERVLTNDKNGEDKKDLAVALVTYGGYAQKNFSINPENPAYGLLDKLSIEQLDLSGITAESLATYTNSQSNTEMGVKATGISTFVDSYIYIRVFLAVEGDISAYTFTLATPTGNVAIEPVFDESTNRYYVDIPDIASAYIDYKYSITVTKGEESNVISTSVLSYARSVLKNSQNSEAKKNLVRALCLYNQAANTFFKD